MEKIMEIISKMTDCELQEVMAAIQKRYASAYPQWDVIYAAVHKDPKLREQELQQIISAIEQDLQWHKNTRTL